MWYAMQSVGRYVSVPCSWVALGSYDKHVQESAITSLNQTIMLRVVRCCVFMDSQT